MPLENARDTARETSAESAHEVASLERHPKDGWTLARPLPLGGGTLRALTAIVRAVAPMEDGPRVPDLLERVTTGVRVQMAYFPALLARGFVVAIHLVDWSPVWRFRSLRRLRSLPRAAAVRHLEALGESRIGALRNLLFPLRAAVLSAYFDQPEVHRAIGYDPLSFMKERIELRRRLLASETAKAADLIEPTKVGGAR